MHCTHKEQTLLARHRSFLAGLNACLDSLDCLALCCWYRHDGAVELWAGGFREFLSKFVVERIGFSGESLSFCCSFWRCSSVHKPGLDGIYRLSVMFSQRDDQITQQSHITAWMDQRFSFYNLELYWSLNFNSLTSRGSSRPFT